MLTYQQRIVEERARLAVRFEMGGKEVVAELDAAQADAMARELALQAALVGVGVPVTYQIGTNFVLLEKHVAAAVARALVAGKLRLDELAEAERIARDSAILIRAGAGFGLSNDARILDEAKKVAAWDSELRRCMVGGIQSTAVVGTPALIQGEPPATR